MVEWMNAHDRATARLRGSRRSVAPTLNNTNLDNGQKETDSMHALC